MVFGLLSDAVSAAKVSKTTTITGVKYNRIR